MTFVSEAWGRRTSYKYLTGYCGILSKLLPGHMVLGYMDFTIHESVCLQQAISNISAFTKGKDQLDPVAVGQTRKIVRVRIHVERVIGFYRNIDSFNELR